MLYYVLSDYKHANKIWNNSENALLHFISTHLPRFCTGLYIFISRFVIHPVNSIVKFCKHLITETNYKLYMGRKVNTIIILYMEHKNCVVLYEVHF